MKQATLFGLMTAGLLALQLNTTAWAAPHAAATATPAPVLSQAATLPPLPKASSATPRATTTPRSQPTRDQSPTPKPQTTRAVKGTGTVSAALPKLPVAKTATPSPLVAVTVVLTDAEATQLAIESMAKEDLPVENLQVFFTKDGMQVTGDVVGSVSGKLVVTGVPVVENESMHFSLDTMTLNGRRLRSYRREVVNAIDDVFRTRFLGQRVKSATLDVGKLNVVVLEKKT